MAKDLVNSKKQTLRSSILYLLYNQHYLTIPNISEKLNVSIPTATKVMEELMEEGWILDSGKAQSSGGRCANLYSLAPDGGYIIMVSTDRHSFKAGIANIHSKIIGSIMTVSKGMIDEKDLLKVLQTTIKELVASSGLNRKKILGIGMAMPGLFDIKTGQNLSYTNLSTEPVRERLGRMFPYPVFIEHDTNAIALAEQSYGLAKGKQNVLCIYLSNTIGVSLILNGQLHKGNSGFAGELGHIPMADEGELCYCGKLGCLETLASGEALLKNAKEAIWDGYPTVLKDMCPTENLTIEHILKGLEQEDSLCIELFNQFSEYISKGISILMHITNPEMIIIGGSLSRANNYLMDPLRQNLDKYVLPQIKNDCIITISDLGTNTMLKGCVALVINELFNNNSNNRQS